MRKLLWVFAAVALISSGALAQQAEKDPLEGVLRIIALSDPFRAAIFADHMNETRHIYGPEAPAMDLATQRKITWGMILKYGLPALSRASDTYAINVLNKAAALADVFAEKYPAGCEYFRTGIMSGEGYLIPEVAESYRAYNKAKAHAYEDGKFRAPMFQMPPEEAVQMATQYLGVRGNELREMLSPRPLSNEQVCSIASRLNTIDSVPEAQRGNWARAVFYLADPATLGLYRGK